MNLLLPWYAASALERITSARVSAAMQVDDSNPMSGIDGRTGLLFNLSQALASRPDFFGQEARPGNLLGMWHLVIICIRGSRDD